MKYKVKIDGQFYDVEVGNLSVRPILASVDGETFEVWPENSLEQNTNLMQYKLSKESTSQVVHTSLTLPDKIPESSATQVQTSRLAATPSESFKTVNAPIPGVITAILVKPGDDVNIGQELCKLEAMKMNNSIRAAKSGKIGSIHISIGQHVKHNEVLIDYVS